MLSHFTTVYTNYMMSYCPNKRNGKTSTTEILKLVGLCLFNPILLGIEAASLFPTVVTLWVLSPCIYMCQILRTQYVQVDAHHTIIQLRVNAIILATTISSGYPDVTLTASILTQQNSYSISHLLGTVTTQWLPLWRCSHCSLVPDTVTTEQWLHRTHMLLGIPYCGTYVEICLLGT